MQAKYLRLIDYQNRSCSGRFGGIKAVFHAEKPRSNLPYHPFAGRKAVFLRAK